MKNGLVHNLRVPKVSHLVDFPNGKLAYSRAMDKIKSGRVRKLLTEGQILKISYPFFGKFGMSTAVPFAFVSQAIWFISDRMI